MIIAIGADHRGFAQKQFIIQSLHDLKIAGTVIELLDVGSFNEQRSDYPEYAIAVCKALGQGKAQLGILLCGTGVGMTIVANRFAGIYAGLAWTDEIAHLNREHDNVNVLVLPSDYISHEQAVKMIMVWLDAQFLGDRYKERIVMIDKLGGVR